MPSRAAAENTSKYVPFLACTAGANSVTLPRSARILAMMDAGLVRRMGVSCVGQCAIPSLA